MNTATQNRKANTNRLLTLPEHVRRALHNVYERTNDGQPLSITRLEQLRTEVGLGDNPRRVCATRQDPNEKAFWFALNTMGNRGTGWLTTERDGNVRTWQQRDLTAADFGLTVQTTVTPQDATALDIGTVTVLHADATDATPQAVAA